MWVQLVFGNQLPERIGSKRGRIFVGIGQGHLQQAESFLQFCRFNGSVDGQFFYIEIYGRYVAGNGGYSNQLHFSWVVRFHNGGNFQSGANLEFLTQFEVWGRRTSGQLVAVMHDRITP